MIERKITSKFICAIVNNSKPCDPDSAANEYGYRADTNQVVRILDLQSTSPWNGIKSWFGHP